MMVGFLEQRLDTRISQGAQGGPTVPGRSKVYLQSGKLQQSFNATMPLHKYDLSYGIRSKADFQAVLDLWYVVNFTPYVGFRHKDTRDYQATVANSALRLISGTTWQLQRKHLFGSVCVFRDILKPVALTVVVYDAGGAQLSSTVDYTTGIATVTGTPASWSGEFDVPVTFTDNEWMATLEVSNAHMQVVSGSIKLEEIRL